MFPKKQRLPSSFIQGVFDKKKKSSKKHKEESVSFFYSEKEEELPRYCIILSKKILSSSVKRNALKRSISPFLREKMKDFPYDIVCILHSKNKNDIKGAISIFFKKVMK
jgi:ribonuclease P protein component